MPGENCSIYGCTVSRRAKYKGLSIFKVPAGENQFDKSWREKLVDVVIRDREVDHALRDRIQRKKIYICEKHFSEDQMNRNHSSRTTLVPGAIPTINLPIKSFPSSSTSSKPRQSAQSILQKKIEPVENVITDRYKSFTDFISKTQLLKLVGWSFTYTSDCASFACHDAIHSVPKYEIYVDNNLVFTVRVLLWSVPAKHDIYSQSLKLITITYLTRLIMDLKLCPGLTDHFAGSCLEHCVPKVFNIKDSTSAPLHQSKWYRSPNCIVLIPPSSEKCLECVRSESKESLSLKRKRDNLISPAKLKAPISMTSPDRIIKTLQNHRLENKELKEELKKMQDEISTCAVPVQKSLGDDFIKIMSIARYHHS